MKALDSPTDYCCVRGVYASNVEEGVKAVSAPEPAVGRSFLCPQYLLLLVVIKKPALEG